MKVEENNHNINNNDIINRETDDEKRARICSLWVINVQTFIFALSFSIVITGVLPYLRQVTADLYIISKTYLMKVLNFKFDQLLIMHLIDINFSFSCYLRIQKKRYCGNTAQLLR